MINITGWVGMFYIEVRNVITGETTEEIIHNKITDEALNEMADLLLGFSQGLEIKYLAVGTDGSDISNPTQLGTEVFRTPPTAGPTRTLVGQIETEFQLLDSEANVSIRELGIFVGTTASATTNSGLLLSRILYTKDKNPNEEIVIKRIDIIKRG